MAGAESGRYARRRVGPRLSGQTSPRALAQKGNQEAGKIVPGQRSVVRRDCRARGLGSNVAPLNDRRTTRADSRIRSSRRKEAQIKFGVRNSEFGIRQSLLASAARIPLFLE